MADLHKEIDTNLDLTEIGENDNWKIELRGDSGANPELRVPQSQVFYGKSASLDYYSIDNFRITNKKSGKELNVLAVTPENWKHKLVLAADKEDTETVYSLENFIYYDEAHRESSWGKGVIANPPSGYGGLNRMPRYIMFNVLYTLSLENVGMPVTLPAAHLTKDEVNKKTEELMKLWNDPSDQRPMNELVQNTWKGL